MATEIPPLNLQTGAFEQPRTFRPYIPPPAVQSYLQLRGGFPADLGDESLADALERDQIQNIGREAADVITRRPFVPSYPAAAAIVTRREAMLQEPEVMLKQEALSNFVPGSPISTIKRWRFLSHPIGQKYLSDYGQDVFNKLAGSHIDALMASTKLDSEAAKAFLEAEALAEGMDPNSSLSRKAVELARASGAKVPEGTSAATVVKMFPEVAGILKTREERAGALERAQIQERIELEKWKREQDQKRRLPGGEMAGVTPGEGPVWDETRKAYARTHDNGPPALKLISDLKKMVTESGGYKWTGIISSEQSALNANFRSKVGQLRELRKKFLDLPEGKFSKKAEEFENSILPMASPFERNTSVLKKLDILEVALREDLARADAAMGVSHGHVESAGAGGSIAGPPPRGGTPPAPAPSPRVAGKVLKTWPDGSYVIVTKEGKRVFYDNRGQASWEK